MYTVTVLKEGYAYTDAEGVQRADGTITLVAGPHVILVDTGAPRDKDFLLQALESRGLRADDLDLVIGTHGHSDHIGNLNLFPNATFVVCYDICKGDSYIDNQLAQGVAYNIDSDTVIIPTPGHTGSDISLVVRNTARGNVVVAGDLFECEDDIEDSAIWREVSEHPEKQTQNRAAVASLADWIVPGHGPMFRVTDQIRELLLTPKIKDPPHQQT